METKICVKCKAEKSIDDFYKSPKSKDGLQSWCKKCMNERSRKNYIDNKDVLKEYHRNKSREFRMRNPNYGKEYQKTYIESESTKVKRRLSNINNHKKNPNYKTLNSIYITIWQAIKRNVYSKKTAYYLGCDKETFFNHINNYMMEDMSMDNYGKLWHFSHILKPGTLDLTKEKDILLFSNYKNLIPTIGKNYKYNT